MFSSEAVRDGLLCSFLFSAELNGLGSLLRKDQEMNVISNMLMYYSFKFMNYMRIVFDEDDSVGDAVGKASSLLSKAYGHLKTLATPVAILMIGFCAFKLLTASDPQSVKQSKSWLLTIIVALALLYLAGPIVNMVTDSF